MRFFLEVRRALTLIRAAGGCVGIQQNFARTAVSIALSHPWPNNLFPLAFVDYSPRAAAGTKRLVSELPSTSPEALEMQFPRFFTTFCKNNC